MNVGPIYGLHFGIYSFFFILYTKNWVFGGPNIFHNEFLAVFGHFGHQNDWFFFKSELFFKTIFEKLEAMMDLHILSDPVKEVWKCPKKGFKNILNMS